MKKYFVFGDVHSYYDELMEALNNTGFDIDNPDHIIISLGDLCDRGPKPKEVLSFVNSLPEERKICVIGNHEIMMELMIRRGRPDIVDIENGIVDTARKIAEEDEEIKDLKYNKYWSEYKKHWYWHFEMDNYIFVHGWIPCYHNTEPFTTKYYEYNLDWREVGVEERYDATYFNGMELWSKGIREPGKIIFCGHWHTSWGHHYLHHKGTKSPTDKKAVHDPFVDEGIIALDASTPDSGKANVYVLELGN